MRAKSKWPRGMYDLRPGYGQKIEEIKTAGFYMRRLVSMIILEKDTFLTLPPSRIWMEIPLFVLLITQLSTTMIYVEHCNHISFTGVIMRNAPFWTLHPAGCDDVLISQIRILNDLNVANSDGIDPDHSTNVRILGCHVTCADDWRKYVSISE